MSRSTPRQGRMGKKIKYTRNPSAAYEEAVEMSRKFHGREPKDVIDLIEEENYDSDLAVLGQLLELNILLENGSSYIPITFCKIGGDGKPVQDLVKMVQICSNAEGTNISFKGGNQILDLEKLFKGGLYQGESSFSKEYCIVGPVYSIVYWTDKHHLEGPKYQAKGTNYEHKFGEQTKDGELPWLVYDTRNGRIMFSGGSYEVREEGIWN